MKLATLILFVIAFTTTATTAQADLSEGFGQIPFGDSDLLQDKPFEGCRRYNGDGWICDVLYDDVPVEVTFVTQQGVYWKTIIQFSNEEDAHRLFEISVQDYGEGYGEGYRSNQTGFSLEELPKWGWEDGDVTAIFEYFSEFGNGRLIIWSETATREVTQRAYDVERGFARPSSTTTYFEPMVDESSWEKKTDLVASKVAAGFSWGVDWLRSAVASVAGFTTTT